MFELSYFGLSTVLCCRLVLGCGLNFNIAVTYKDLPHSLALPTSFQAGVVAQTKIVYHEKELLQLIHGHMTSLGLHESASTLQREAGLPKCSTPPPHNTGSAAATGHLYSPSTPKLVSRYAISTVTAHLSW